MSDHLDPTVDYYQALGVDPKAKPDEIKRAYRKLAKQYHPDSTGGDKAKEQRFKQVSAAYDVLGDAQQRAQYDELRSLGGGRRPGTGPFSTGGPGFGGSQVWDLGDLFTQMFSAGSPGTGNPGAGNPGGAASGGRRGGRRASTATATNVRFERSGGEPDGGFDRGGPAGPGPTVPLESKLQAPDGSWLTVRGHDVHSDLRVPFHHAILGTVAEVATLGGATAVKIPPGTSSGRRLRLRGKGVATDGGSPGDHYVTVHLDVPATLDDEGQRLLHALTTHLAGLASSSKRP